MLNVFCLGITDCTRAFYIPYGIYLVRSDGIRYGQCVLLEVPDSGAWYMRLNSDVLTEWAISVHNDATTEIVTVGNESFLMVHFTPIKYWNEGNRYFLILYNKNIEVSLTYNYDPEKDAKVPVIEYEIRRGDKA